MSLSYEEGMATLRSIFPSWDVEVLAQLLEANEGHLENTIDMALSMEPPRAEATQAAPAAHVASARTPPPAPSTPSYASPSHGSRRSPRASPREKPRRSRVTLPDDFLRLPGETGGAPQSAADMSEQERQDALLAQMMQDEIFREQLMADEEFSSHFHDNRGGRRDSEMRRSSVSRPPEKSAAEIANETFTAMSAKWSIMSETMKKKAHEMYLKFQTRADAPAKQDPYSHRPLMADDSSDEEDGHDARMGSADVRHRHAHDEATTRDSAFSPRSRGANGSRRSNTGTNKKDD